MSIDPILIPIIRQMLPQKIAEDICSVQSMGDAAGIYKLPTRWELEEFDALPYEPKQGDKRHMFGRGWQVYYGTEWIPESIWWKLKIKGL